MTLPTSVSLSHSSTRLYVMAAPTAKPRRMFKARMYLPVVLSFDAASSSFGIRPLGVSVFSSLHISLSPGICSSELGIPASFARSPRFSFSPPPGLNLSPRSISTISLGLTTCRLRPWSRIAASTARSASEPVPDFHFWNSSRALPAAPTTARRASRIPVARCESVSFSQFWITPTRGRTCPTK